MPHLGNYGEKNEVELSFKSYQRTLLISTILKESITSLNEWG